MKTFLLIFALLASGFAQDGTTPVGLEWDANTEWDLAGYRVSVSPTDGEQGEWFEVTGTLKAFDLAPGLHIARVTAFNTAGLESEPSELTFEVVASIRLTIQRSTDLQTWSDIYSQVMPMVGPRGVFRLKLSMQ